MINEYTVLARFYDALNTECDYDELAEYLHRSIKKYRTCNTELVLDLACGTGAVTGRLNEKGYDMTGVDISPEMLSVAKERYPDKNILWLCQDMREFELYGTVGAVVCCLDSINYLLKTTDIEKCFSLVHNYLDPDGLFIFDMNTPYKFRNVYADNNFVLETEDIFCVWQNYYKEKSGICDFDLSIFAKNPDGTYSRTNELQRERCYNSKTILKLLEQTGFTVLQTAGDTNGKELEESDERMYFIAKAIK